MKKETVKYTAIDILKGIGKLILKGIVTGAIFEAGERFGVPISASYCYTTGNRLPHPSNATQQAIKGIHDCAIDASFDSNKVNAAYRIYSVLENACPDDDTKRYAMIALESLADKCDFGSSKESITRKIEQIAKIKAVDVVAEQ